MRRWTLFLVLALLISVGLLVAIFYPALASGLIVFQYPPGHPGAPEGTVWGTAEGKVVPLAPGVSIPLEEPLELKTWPETEAPSAP